MNNRPQGSVWAKPCPMPTITPFIYRAAAAAAVLLPVIVPGCCVLARSAA
jgi:hypothetical protein